MSDRVRYRPFTGDDQTHIRLESAPLEMVLCQVRWPELGYLQEDRLDPIAKDFGARLNDYPFYSPTPELSFSVGPTGVEQNEVGVIHQWSSQDGTKHVSLGRTFLSVYSRDYRGWAEFITEVQAVLGCLNDSVDVRRVERIGVRYLNRIVDQEVMSHLSELVKPEVLGYQALPLPVDSDVHLVQALNQTQIQVGDGVLQVRSGVIPAGQTVDPSVEAVNGPSWILDIDASAEVGTPFNSDEVVERAGKLSDSAYDFFKLVIKSGFVEHFGRRDDNADSDAT